LKVEDVKPEICHGDHGLGHEAVTLHGGVEPEATIVVPLAKETDGAEDAGRICVKAQCPVPLVAALHGRQRVPLVVAEDAIVGERPGNAGVQKANNLPLGEKLLHLLGIGEFQWTKDEAIGPERRCHGRRIAPPDGRADADSTGKLTTGEVAANAPAMDRY
jgi:hypothetical protein